MFYTRKNPIFFVVKCIEKVQDGLFCMNGIKIHMEKYSETRDALKGYVRIKIY